MTALNGTEAQRGVRPVENVWIPMPDGCRLAANLWLPEDAEDDPVPAVFVYEPYRKDDLSAHQDAHIQPFLASHGYAALRVDIRGSGSSDGILRDEYSEQEQDDAVAVIEWIADRRWCTGAVGMWGGSWGGFNTLQVAARRPPALKAAISRVASDDRYADDVHYIGGCVLAVDALTWASVMLGFNALPPDPDVVGGRWREQWLERLKETPSFIEPWLTHQRRDAYWKHGSVCEDYGRIGCPVYMIGGWADSYTNAVPRFLAGHSGPRKGLIGAGPHGPGAPGPAIDQNQEALRWWDHWLKGIPNGIMDEPLLRVWMQEWTEPSATPPAIRPGRWVAEAEWPSSRIQTHSWFPADDGTLRDQAPAEGRLEHRGPQDTGIAAGAWAPGRSGEFPPDQRAEDGRSLSFTSRPLSNRLEILGSPELTVRLAVDRARALVAVRLCDVAPDGSSLLVTRGLLNLTHRESHEHPEPLEPGRRYDVRVSLKVSAHVFAPGHRLRVALSPTYWPWAWPSPEEVTLEVFTGSKTALALPVRPTHSEDAEFAPPPEHPVTTRREATIYPSVADPAVRQDLESGRTEVSLYGVDAGWRIASTGTDWRQFMSDVYTIVEGEPLSAEVRCERRFAIVRGEWRTRVETVSTMTSDADVFRVTNLVEAYEGETRIFAKTESITVPRDLV